MTQDQRMISRRSMLRGGLAAGAAGLLIAVPSAAATATTGPDAELRELETRHGARLGVYGVNTVTGATVAYRAAERFPMCSTFKTLAASAILRDRDHDGTFLRRVLHYTKDDLVAGSPITGQHVDTGMSVADVCAAAIRYSDNTAGNLMLGQIGGPAGLTRFARSLGDPITRLDRFETELNTAIPGDPRDTTTPSAIGADYRRLVLGQALCPGDRAQLITWLKGNTTSTKRFRAGLPATWQLGDKTGTGDYGTANDVGVAWTGSGTPILLAVLSTKAVQDAPGDDALVAETARVLARTLAPGE